MMELQKQADEKRKAFAQIKQKAVMAQKESTKEDAKYNTDEEEYEAENQKTIQ